MSRLSVKRKRWEASVMSMMGEHDHAVQIRVQEEVAGRARPDFLKVQGPEVGESVRNADLPVS